MTKGKNALLKIALHPYFPIVLAPLVLFSPLILSGKALIWGTPSTQFFPWWDFAYNSILKGEFPLWNPQLGMGAPLAANYQVGLFYPPYLINFLFYIVGGLDWMAWAATVVVCFHLILSGIGMARLVRYMNAGKLGQTISGLSFSLSGYLIARAGFFSINAAVTWLPWILLTTINLVEGKKSSLQNLIMVSTLLLLAGHAQTAWYIFLLGAIWFVYWFVVRAVITLNKFNPLRTLANYILANVLAVGISAIQLLPTLEYLVNSHRAGEYGFREAMTYSFWPWRFLTLLVPDLYGSPASGNYWGYGNYWEDAVYIGIFSLFLALGFLVKSAVSKRKLSLVSSHGESQKPILFLGLITAVSFLLALGSNTVIYPYLYRNIPTFDLFQAPTRWTIWAVASLAILAGFGIDSLKPPAGKSLYIMRLTAAGCVAVSIGSILASFLISDLETTFFPATAKAGLVAFCAALLVLFVPQDKASKAYKTWSILAVLLVMFDLIAVGWGLNPGVNKNFYQVKRKSDSEVRMWMPADVEYELKFNAFFSFSTFEPRWDWEIMHESYLPNIGILQGAKLVNNFDPILPEKYTKWMGRLNSTDMNERALELMNVSQIIFLTNGFPEIRNNNLVNPSQIYVAGCAKVISQEEQALDLIYSGNEEYSLELLLISEKDIPCNRGARGSARIIENRNGYLNTYVNLSDNGWLFWSQTHFPGWKARVDGGNYLDVVPANYLFQAVPVPAGEHQVEFVYRPNSFILGAGISGLSLFIWVGWILLKRRQSINEQDQEEERS